MSSLIFRGASRAYNSIGAFTLGENDDDKQAGPIIRTAVFWDRADGPPSHLVVTWALMRIGKVCLLAHHCGGIEKTDAMLLNVAFCFRGVPGKV
jgi:hypothetical protein